ncbi:MAG: hypothetical protein JWM98_3086 [Thermoleophilia bacterium]|nr:hypothetical protein [Thermoleophilia bacterium]
MSYETALQRMGELRSLTGAGPLTLTSTGTTVASPGAFDAQLAQQQALLGARSDGAASAAAGGTAAPAAETMSQYGVPILTVADQYRMLGIDVPTAGGVGPAAGASGAGARMVALAQGELGVTETSGNNDGPRIREYRSATAGAQDSPGPWCAYFVSWLAKNAGAPVGAGGNGTGYVPTLEAWGKQQDRFVEFGSQQPKPGDIAIFDWGGDGTPDHTGIVESVGADGTINTIEGNSSDRVQRRSYAASTNDIRGFVRPG